MKNNYLKLMTALLLTAFATVTQAYDFCEVNEGDSIWYNITSEENKTCEVTYGSEDEGYTYYEDSLRYKGTIIIPSEVTHEDITYTVTGIGYDAFFYCTQLEKVTIPSSVTYIEVWAFGYCENLSDIGELPSELRSIGDYAFCYTSIGSVTIPATVESIGATSFEACKKLTTLTVAEGNEYYTAVDNVLFDKNMTTLLQYPAGLEAEYYKVPESVKKIERYSMAYSKLKGIQMISVDTIGNAAFFDDTLLTEITIPASVKSIGKSSFRGCTNLKYIEVESGNANYVDEEGVLYTKNMESLICYPEGKEDTEYTVNSDCKNICKSAFRYNRYITNITLPEGLDSIGGWAFGQCPSLKELNIPASVSYIPDGSIVYYSTALESLTVDAENPYYMAEDNVLFTKDKTILIAYAANSAQESYSIPDKVDSIAFDALSYARNLSKIVIPASVTKIGLCAFCCDPYYNIIDTIVLESSVPLTGENIDRGWIFRDEYEPDYIYNHTILVVPDGSKESYEKTSPWSNFLNIMTNSEVTGINEINADNTPASVTTDERIYDLQGRRLEVMPENGVYIRGGKKHLGN